MMLALIILVLMHTNLCRAETITEHCHNAYRKLTPPDEGEHGFGAPAKLKEFPHLVAIGWSGSNSIFWGCGGSLVTTKFVVSAAHCGFRSQNGESVQPDVAKIGLIDLFFKSDREKFTQEFRIAKIIIHPQYKSSRRYFDIALMELNREVRVTEYVMPVCLWNSQREVFTTLEASGFGETVFGGGTSPTLQKARVTRTSYNECKKIYSPAVKRDRKLPHGIFQYQHMCASDKTEAGEDTCQGDSGGPLEFKMMTKVQDQWLKVPVLVGVTSFGEAGCGNSVPAVYTRVASFIPWIECETKQNLNLEACSKLYTDRRAHTFSPFSNLELPSNVLIVNFFGICTGVIIHERFVLAAEECASDSEGGYIRTSDGQEIGIETIYQNGSLTLLKLKEDIKYTKTRRADFIYSIGPTCLESEPTLDEVHFVKAKFQNSTEQIVNSKLYNVSECLEYLGETNHVDESSYECLSGVWLVPNECKIEKSTFSFHQRNLGAGFHKFPSLRSFVVNQENCGSILMKKIMKPDIDWINFVIFGKQ